MGMIPTTDLNAHVKAFQAGATANAGAPLLIVAGGAGDNTAVTGRSIDTLDQRGDSMMFAVSAHAALAQDETLSIAAEFQESADNSTWDTAVALQASTVLLTGGAGGSNEYGVAKFHCELKHRKRYIRLNFTPNLSAGATDTASVHGLAFMAGGHVLPTT